jgi:hypothetical protein
MYLKEACIHDLMRPTTRSPQDWVAVGYAGEVSLPAELKDAPLAGTELESLADPERTPLTSVVDLTKYSLHLQLQT